eukprot:COSAG02_NODE_27320_length_612_cov_1.083821_1_plen_34_part_01
MTSIDTAREPLLVTVPACVYPADGAARVSIARSR